MPSLSWTVAKRKLPRKGAGLPVLLSMGLLLAVVGACLADEVELTNGIRVQGRVVKQAAEAVTIATDAGGQDQQMVFPLAKVRAITINGQRQAVNEGPAQKAREDAEASHAPGRGKPGGSADELVEKVGPSEPDWLNRQPVKTPQSLDKRWSDTSDDPNRNFTLFWRRTILPDRDRWQDGARILHYLLKENENNPDGLKKTQVALGDLYYRMKDWPRAAWWWKKAEAEGSHDFPNGLVIAYARMGDKSRLRQMIGDAKEDATADFRILRLCLEAGENQMAERLIEAVVGGRRNTDGYTAAGRRFEQAGVPLAAAYCYEKALNDAQGRIWDRNKIQAGRLLAALFASGLAPDLSKIPDGAYRNGARGFCGPVAVEVTVRDGRISGVKVVQTKENRDKGSLASVPRQIAEKQGLRGVDAVTGATITSSAICIATGKALKMAEKN